jgi:lipopolysaccharide export system protein LptA
LRSQHLDYSKGVAFLRGNVVLVHKGQTLKTPTLRYDTEAETGQFLQGAEIETDDGHLTCQSGRYSASDEHFVFEGKVHAVTEDYILDCPKMEQWPGQHRYYVPKPGVAQSKVPSGDSYRLRGFMRFGRAWMWSASDGQSSAFSHGIEGVDSTVQFSADSLYRMEGEQELYGASEPAKWSDWTGDSLEIHGAYIFKDDWMARAEGQVETFARGLVCRSNTMEWLKADSLLNFSGQPMVWTDEYLLRSDTLRWFQHHPSGLDSLYGSGQVHISKPVDSLRYDEMAGNFLYGFLEDAGMKSLKIKGNAQALFQPDPERSSNIQCADILLEFEEGQLKWVRFNKGPQGQVSDPTPSLHLPGFAGETVQRPVRMEAISGLK